MDDFDEGTMVVVMEMETETDTELVTVTAQETLLLDSMWSASDDAFVVNPSPIRRRRTTTTTSTTASESSQAKQSNPADIRRIKKIFAEHNHDGRVDLEDDYLSLNSSPSNRLASTDSPLPDPVSSKDGIRDRMEEDFDYLLTQNVRPGNGQRPVDSISNDSKSEDVTFPSQELRKDQGSEVKKTNRGRTISPPVITPDDSENKRQSGEDMDQRLFPEDEGHDKDLPLDNSPPKLLEVTMEPINDTYPSPVKVAHPSASLGSHTSSFAKRCEGKPLKIVYPLLKKHVPLPASLRPVVGLLLQMEASWCAPQIIEHACKVVSDKCIECRSEQDTIDLPGKVFGLLAADLGSAIDLNRLFQASKEGLAEEGDTLSEIQREVQLFFDSAQYREAEGQKNDRDVQAMDGADKNDHSDIHGCHGRRYEGPIHSYHYPEPEHYNVQHPQYDKQVYHAPQYPSYSHHYGQLKTAGIYPSQHPRHTMAPGMLELAVVYGAHHAGRILSSHGHHNIFAASSSATSHPLTSASLKQFVDGACNDIFNMTDDDKIRLWQTANSSWPSPRFEA
jgi:hypothetical protein